jgi:hypothetical protein
LVCACKKFTHWVAALPNEEIIQAYKKNAYQIKQSAVEMALKKLKNGGDAQTIITQLGDQLRSSTVYKNTSSSCATSGSISLGMAISNINIGLCLRVLSALSINLKNLKMGEMHKQLSLN